MSDVLELYDENGSNFFYCDRDKDALKVGETATVKRLHGEGPVKRRIMDMGLTKGTTLKVELDGGRIILRKDVSEALRKVRGSFKLAEGFSSTDEAMRALRGRAPGDPLEPFEVLRDPADWKPEGKP